MAMQQASACEPPDDRSRDRDALSGLGTRLSWPGAGSRPRPRPAGPAMSVTFRMADGEWGRVPLSDAGAVALESGQPVRDPTRRLTRWAIGGLFWFATSDRMVVYESKLEQDALLLLDYQRNVADVLGQPFVLHPTAARTGYVPDLLVVLRDGSRIVVDVKPRHRLDDAQVRRRLRAVAALCATAGWEYFVHTGISAQTLVNLRWLSCDRRPPACLNELGPLVIDACRQPKPIGWLTSELGDAPVVLPVLFHLIWWRELEIDLERPMTRQTLVTTAAS